jgi:hypothetical protein
MVGAALGAQISLDEMAAAFQAADNQHRAEWCTTAEGHGRPIVPRVIQFRELFTFPPNHFPGVIF